VFEPRQSVRGFFLSAETWLDAEPVRRFDHHVDYMVAPFSCDLKVVSFIKNR
jgi:hypothetical protein